MKKVFTLADGEYCTIEAFTVCQVVYGDGEGMFVVQDDDGNRDAYDENNLEFLN